MKSIKFNRIKNFFSETAETIAEHSFLASLALILLAVVLGGLILFKYSFLAEREEVEVLEKPLFFNEAAMRDIKNIWQERQKRFEEAGTRKYPELF